MVTSFNMLWCIWIVGTMEEKEYNKQSETGSNGFSRRTFLSTGTSVLGLAGISGLSLTGISTAQPDQNGTDDIGITDKVEKLILNDKEKQASQLLDSHEIPHGYSKEHVGSESGITPSWAYTESGTNISMFLTLQYNDVWSALGSVTFHKDEERYTRGTPNNVADGCGIIFDHAEWSALQPSDDGVTYLDKSADYLNMVHEEYNPNYGPAAKIHHQIGSPTDDHAAMKTKLTRSNTGNGNIPVQFSYEHTYALVPRNPVSVSVSAGVLAVDLPTGSSTAWRDETTASP